MQKDINNKIKDALNSLGGVEQASAKPFFFTRLEARMQKEKNTWEKISSFFASPAIAFACICLVVMINVAVIFSSKKTQSNVTNQNDELATVDEYSQVSSGFYEFVNTKP